MIETLQEMADDMYAASIAETAIEEYTKPFLDKVVAGEAKGDKYTIRLARVCVNAKRDRDRYVTQFDALEEAISKLKGTK